VAEEKTPKPRKKRKLNNGKEGNAEGKTELESPKLKKSQSETKGKKKGISVSPPASELKLKLTKLEDSE